MRDLGKINWVNTCRSNNIFTDIAKVCCIGIMGVGIISFQLHTFNNMGEGMRENSYRKMNAKFGVWPKSHLLLFCFRFRSSYCFHMYRACAARDTDQQPLLVKIYFLSLVVDCFCVHNSNPWKDFLHRRHTIHICRQR